MPLLRRSAAALAVSASLLAGGCGGGGPTSIDAKPAASTQPLVDGPCPDDRIGSRTVAHDPVLICADTASGSRWLVSSDQPVAPAPTAAATPAAIPIPAPAVDCGASLRANQTYLDAVEGSIRQVEGAIAQIQLVIDNSGRDLDRVTRYAATVQADYDHAVAYAEAVGGLDSAKDEVARQEGRLADANGSVATWQAIIVKGQGDLSRAQAQKADYDQKVREVTPLIQQAAAGNC